MLFPFPFIDVLTIPTDAGPGDARIVIDGTTGTIIFYDDQDRIVGLLSTELWYVGILEEAHVAIDPFGGLRIYNADGLLAGLFNAEGLQLADPAAQLVPTILSPYDLLITAPSGSVQVGILEPLPGAPRYGGTSEASPGTTIDTPSVNMFTTADLELRHAATARIGASASSVSFTAPGSYTEETDSGFTVAGKGSISTTVASRQPAVSNAIRTFTASASTQTYGLGATVVIKGEVGGTPPSIRDINSLNDDGTATDQTFSLAPPTGTVAGDVLVAFVCVEHCDVAALPTGWTTPTGWKFLGAQFQVGASSSFACGVFYKIATASEPATYDVTITTGPGTKLYNARLVGVQDAFTNPEGADIQINGKSIPRGAKQMFRSTGNDVARGNGVNTDMTVTSPLLAGRTYSVHLHTQANVSATSVYALECDLNGTIIGRFQRWSAGETPAGSLTVHADGTVTFTAAADDPAAVFTVQVTAVVGGATMTMTAGATNARTLTVKDEGVLE